MPESDAQYRNRELRLFLSNGNALLGLALLASAIVVAILAPLMFPGDPLNMVTRPFLWPGEDPAYPLGSDSLGRDLLSGILHGARTSLYVGFSATVIGFGIGVLVGATAGYFGGVVDVVLVKLIEIFQTLPNFVLVVVIVAILEPNSTVVAAAIGIVSWPTIARLTRAEFRSIREKDYVTAARSLGCADLHIMFREILPNALPPLIVASSIMVAQAILMESGLSFMGLSDPNVVSWGSIIGNGREFIRTAWYLTALPGVAIVIAVLSLNLIGDGLNDALNPRSRKD